MLGTGLRRDQNGESSKVSNQPTKPAPIPDSINLTALQQQCVKLEPNMSLHSIERSFAMYVLQ